MSYRTEDARAANDPPRTVVIGVGNLLLKDEGVGIHVVQALQKTPLKGDGELMVIDGGTSPDIFHLLPESIDKLIVVDAVKGGSEPGSIYRFTPTDVAFSKGTITSVHQLGLVEGLRMMEFAEVSPKAIVIIGVEPKEIGWGLEISPELQEQVPRIIDLVKEEIGN